MSDHSKVGRGMQKKQRVFVRFCRGVDGCRAGT